LVRIGVVFFALTAWGHAGDILRRNAPATPATGSSGSGAGGPGTNPTGILPSAQDRLARTSQAVNAVRQMQAAARQLATTGPNNLRPGLPVVPVNSYGGANGLRLAPGVPLDLAHPSGAETAALWTGANLPAVTTNATNGTSTVTIQQTAQQAILNWQTFNLGRNTTLTFDQGAGGANVGQWIAFNFVRDPTGAPSQILGSIRTIGAPDSSGRATVGGQVYVMNANGIIFGGSSQVNAHGLVASSLPVNYNLIQRGLINNPDTQFLFSALPQAAGGQGPTPAFDPASAAGAVPVQTAYASDGSGDTGNYGDVVVQPGALINVPTSVDHVGGRVALIGANVSNAGMISTPDGQTIMAAGLQVGWVASSDPGLRGLDVYVGAVSDDSGTVANDLDPTHPTASNLTFTNPDGTTGTVAAGTPIAGLIDGRRVDGTMADVAVTLVGKTVNQLGVIDNATSVAFNGRIDLLAEYNAIANSRYILGSNLPVFIRQSTDDDVSVGTVTFGTSSITRILPDVASNDRVIGTSLALPSEIKVRGQAIHLASNGTAASAATILAPSARVVLGAGKWIAANGADAFIHSDGQIYFDPGTTIDVSGLVDVTASVTENIVEVELRGPQLADSPLQRDGALRGLTVQIDLRQVGTYQGRNWVGTPLADATGYVGLVQRTVGELSTAGGTVTIAAGGSVVMNKDATVNVSGGSINYQGGLIQTTKVISNGHIYDISQATPDRVYEGIYDAISTTIDPKWGVANSNLNPLPQTQGTYSPGYIQGGNGGSLTISAPAAVLDGRLAGTVVQGARQRTPAGQLAKMFSDSTFSSILPAIQSAIGLPSPSSLVLKFEQDYQREASGLIFQRSPTPPKVVLTSALNPMEAVEAFPRSSSGDIFADLGARGKAGARIQLSPNLVSANATEGHGFGSLAVTNGEGDITLASNLTTPSNGTLAFDAATIFVSPNVSVRSPGGSLSFTAHNRSPYDYLLEASLNLFTLPEPDPDRGGFSLGPGATLSTAGLVVDERAGRPGAGTAPLVTNGYHLDAATGAEVDAVAIRAYRVDLGNGSTVDVSGGVTAGTTGKMTYGNAGKISILAVLDPQGPATQAIGQDPADGGGTPDLRGYLHFNPDHVRFKGYAGQGGRSGALTLQAQLIQVENPLAIGTTADLALVSPLNLDPTHTLLLAPDFFSQGGFGSYSLIGIGEVARGAGGNILNDLVGPGVQYVPGVFIAPTLLSASGQPLSTVISPQAANWLAIIDPAQSGQVVLAADSSRLPLGARNPVSLRFTAAGASYNSGADITLFARGDVKIANGAVIQVDPLGAVGLVGDTVEVNGKIFAPAGSIEVKGGTSYTGDGFTLPEEGLPTVVLGTDSELSAVGVILGPAGLAPNPGLLGNMNTGAALAGGRIAIAGNIVAEKNAVIDVSGASGTLDLLPGYSGGSALYGVVPTAVASNGGSITLTGAQLLVTNATLRGAAGADSTQGGSLELSSGRFSLLPILPTDLNLEVSEFGPVLDPDRTGLGLAVVNAGGNAVASYGHFAAADFWNPGTHATVGGFGSLTLQGNVQFTGAVELGADRSLTIATGGLIYSVAQGTSPDQIIVLQAPHVALGLPFQAPVQTGVGSIPPVSIFRDPTSNPYYFAPQPGPGSLEVKADSLISLGTLSLQGISLASFSTEKNGQAVAGDIRGDGVLDIAGSFDFTAGQVYPPTAVSFTIAAYDYATLDGAMHEGSVTFHPVVDATGATILPALPLSAGGKLTVYASTITQGGVLRAPLGTINLGWNGVGTPPTQDTVNGVPPDLVVGPGSLQIATTGTLTMAKGGVTSVSAVDPTTGLPVTIPFGYSTDGTTWIDPSGADITVVGPPRKSVSVSAVDLIGEKGSLIDIGGGGDLYAYRWIPGVGGTKDILSPTYVPNAASPTLQSFSVLPGYQAGFAPYATFGSAAADPGYVAGGGLAVGDMVHLDLRDGQGAQDYTLLPARYALLPGAYLVTPTSGAPSSNGNTQADGSIIVAGYRANSLAPVGTTPVRMAFEVASGTPAATSPATPVTSVVRTRAQYADFFANTFFPPSALSANLPVWRLPVDAGYLLLTAAGGGTIRFDGDITAKPLAGTDGKGGLVDIDSPSDILIDHSQASVASIAAIIGNLGLVDPLVLDAATLNNFGAESLLIGGYRTSGATGESVHVSTGQLAVANAGEALLGSDIILVANTSLRLDDNASIAPRAMLTGADELVFGQLDANGVVVGASGNGAVLRVSSDPLAQINRLGADQSTAASLSVGRGVQLGLAGGTVGSITLDSTNATSLDSSAALNAQSIALGSGQISLQFDGAGALRTQANGAVTQGLVLSDAAIRTLETSAQSLALLSYTSIDLYGAGELGNADFAQISLHTPELYSDGGVVKFVAQDIQLDNRANAAAADQVVALPAMGKLQFTSDRFQLGTGQVAVNHVSSIAINAASRVTFDGVGNLITQGDLTMTTPLVTATTASNQTVIAGGKLAVTGTTGTTTGDGLGAQLTLVGSDVAIDSLIQMTSGNLTLHAANGDVAVNGPLDVGGSARTFYDLPKYTDGGQVSLIADHGNVNVNSGGRVNVSGAATDPADTANAGSDFASSGGMLKVAVENGLFAVAGEISGEGINSARSGAFSLDTGALPSLTPLESALADGGFARAQTIRVRQGDAVIEGTVTAHVFSLSTDQGSIEVTNSGVIDASGAMGGAISLAARGSVSIDGGAVLTVAADDFNAAGKGGVVTLESGTSYFDSSGAYVAPAASAAVGVGGTIDLSVGRVQIDLLAETAVHFPRGTPGAGQVAFSEGGAYMDANGTVVTIAKGETVSLPVGSTVVLTKTGTAAYVGNGLDGSIPVVFSDGSSASLRPGLGGAAGLAAALADAALGKSSGTLHLRGPQVDGGGNPLPADNSGTAGVDLAVKPITGTIIGASNIVVEGYKVFVPPAGSIDAVKSNVAVNGQGFVDNTGDAATPGTILGRLLAGVVDPVARNQLASVIHLRPGAEIVNASNAGAPTSTLVTAGAANNTLTLVAGSSFTLGSLSAAAGRIVSTTASGRIISADGTSKVLKTTDTNVVLVAGSTVILDTDGTVTLGVTRTGLAAGSGTLVLAAGTKLSGTNGVGFNPGSGTNLTLSTAGTSVVALGAATPVVFANGGRVRFSSAGTITSLSGTVTSFSAAATVTVVAGSTVKLNAAGSITFVSGTAPVLSLASGSFSTTGLSTLAITVGDLALTNDWNLAANHFTPTGSSLIGEPEMITLRAAGNLVFNGTLSDGFENATYSAALLADGSQSASYRLVAGADLTAADFNRVRPSSALGVATGSLLLGRNGVGSATAGPNALTSNILSGHYEVIRTGTGDIEIATGGNVLLLNQFAAIYTAGRNSADATLGNAFDVPVLDQNQYSAGSPLGAPQQATSYPVHYSLNGGDVAIYAQGDIAHKTQNSAGQLIDDSQQELPNNWLYRRALIDPATGKFYRGVVDAEARGLIPTDTGEVMSTTWWVDFSNFFEGVGALGGGNVTLVAGRDIMNVDALVPTNARMLGKDSAGAALAPDAANLIELGGGSVVVRAGRDINGGVYYVERGKGSLDAGRSILTNATRSFGRVKTVAETWLPTTLFLGKGDFTVSAHGDLRLGPVANPFLLPAGISNTAWNKSYFSTFAPEDVVEVSSLTGSVRLTENAPNPVLFSWLSAVSVLNTANASNARPWLRLNENTVASFNVATALAPATLRAIAYSGDLYIVGDLELAPSAQGTIDLAAAGSISGLNPMTNAKAWGYSTIRLLDADPASIPAITKPLATVAWSVPNVTFVTPTLFSGINSLFQEGDSTANDSLQTKLSRHSAGLLHANDYRPVRIYATDGDISGLSLFAGKSARIVAADNISDISFSLQNNHASDISLVSAGRDLIAYDPNSPLRQLASAATFARNTDKVSGKSGQIEIGGPGTLEVFAGRNFDLGVDPSNAAVGITSIGATRNPNLPFAGASVAAAAGLGDTYTPAAAQQLMAPGLRSTALGFADFVTFFLRPDTANGTRYLPALGAALGLPANTSNADIAGEVAPGRMTESKTLALLKIFYQVLRDSARDRNDVDSAQFGTYTNGFAAINAFFPGSPQPTKDDLESTVPVVRPAAPWSGSFSLSTREIKTFAGGNISLLVPGGDVTVGRATDPQKPDQGILTEHGGAIDIFAADSVNVGTSRIFTLRGGDEVIWSTWGNIAAGSGSKTVFSAPPTRVIIDPQSGDVLNDLAGLATGSGIGVLATLSGVKPGDVDLVAPVGTIDAGDAGIRSSGNLNLAARVVLNAGNISAGGATVGAPPAPAAPNLAGLTSASNASASQSSAASELAKQGPAASAMVELPSIVTVEVLGYGGSEENESDTAHGDEDEKKKRLQAEGPP